MQAEPPEADSTIARVRGEPQEVSTLQVEEGNVWPAQEGPRATLANPDAAMRNIPVYRPGELDRMSAPPAIPLLAAGGPAEPAAGAAGDQQRQLPAAAAAPADRAAARRRQAFHPAPAAAAAAGLTAR